jgi:hypothetical protein
MAPPGLDWYYNSHTGAVQILPKPQGEALLHLGIGWHGPFDTKDEALAYYERNAPNNPGWKAPTGWKGNISNALDTAGDAASAVTEPISDFTTGIAAAINTAIKLVPRVLEATLGIVLLAIAANVILKQATGVDVAGSAARAGTKVAKTAAVL